MRHNFDLPLFLFVSLPIVFLSGVVVHFWIAPPELSFVEEVFLPRVSPSFQIQLEKAKVSRIGKNGREWEVWADSIEQRGEEVHLYLLAGTIFQSAEPRYRFSAERGTFFPGDGTMKMWKVKLREEGKGERAIHGEALSWLGKAEELTIYGVRIFTPGVTAGCQKLVYNVTQGKMLWKGNVEITVKTP